MFGNDGSTVFHVLSVEKLWMVFYRCFLGCMGWWWWRKERICVQSNERFSRLHQGVQFPGIPLCTGGSLRVVINLVTFHLCLDGIAEHVSQSILSREVSDHCHVLLDCDGARSGKSLFSFKNMWLKKEGFSDLIRSWGAKL